MNKMHTTLGMTVLAGALVAPMLAFGQAANNSTGTAAPAPMVQRAPDGTPGNPPGTAATRALDRAAGTNTSGAYPSQSDGTPGNPPGTALGRAADRATDGANNAARSVAPNSPDGTPGNPPGTAATRALDRAAGTNTSGAYPSQSDGTPANPPGTALGRAADRAGDAARSATTAPATDGRANVATTGAMTGGAMAGIFSERQRVSQIIGSRVYNDRNEAIGEVDDIIMTGTTPTAIVSVGGFLGIGARLVAVPMTDLQWNGERERIMLPGATKEQLQSRPAFDYGSLRRS
ncbi:PRC-barrel domain-containing protein [Roseococcus sp. DSY-14]|uniref:PRC-barrel domain-containing protein n=1 Tax=Roseococcus sp. DSY-14 TaxID=3369650 RepID=UPI00387AE761